MKLIKIQNLLEEWSPLENSEDFDNVGLIIGNPNSEVNGALITIDVTEKVIDEAINMDYNLIITFHPLMYKGSSKLNSEEYVDICIEKALKNNLNVYCIHTNLDNNPKGVSYQISRKLKLINPNIFIKQNGVDNIGMGIIGELKDELSEIEFLDYLKTSMDLSNIRHSNFR